MSFRRSVGKNKIMHIFRDSNLKNLVKHSHPFNAYHANALILIPGIISKEMIFLWSQSFVMQYSIGLIQFCYKECDLKIYHK